MFTERVFLDLPAVFYHVSPNLNPLSLSLMSHHCEDTKLQPTRSLLSPEEMGVSSVGGRVKINDDAATLAAAVRSAENGSLEGVCGVCVVCAVSPAVLPGQGHRFMRVRTGLPVFPIELVIRHMVDNQSIPAYRTAAHILMGLVD